LRFEVYIVVKIYIVVMVKTLGSVVMAANISEYPSSGPAGLHAIWGRELLYDTVSS
jgi:hypothetical protein